MAVHLENGGVLESQAAASASIRVSPRRACAGSILGNFPEKEVQERERRSEGALVPFR